MEEVVCRLPLLVASWQIDALSSEYITSPLLEGVIDLTGGQTLKIALAVILSIEFTYGHGSNLDPSRAAGAFASGLALSHLTLRPNGGLENAIVAHAINNLVSRLLGLEIGNGMTLNDTQEDSEPEEK